MKKILLAAALGLITAYNTQAQITTIASWDVSGTGTSDNTGYAAGFEAPNSDTSGLGRTTVTWTSAVNSFNSNNWNTGAFNQNTNYINFTITPSSGYEITYTSLQFAMNGSNTGPQQGRWGYSIGGGSFTTFDFTLTNPAPTSLTTWDFVDFTTASSVEFRFWAFGTTSINGGTSAPTGTVRIANISGNDLVLNGSVAAIPEPSTYALISLGLGALVFLRRKMAKA